VSNEQIKIKSRLEGERGGSSQGFGIAARVLKCSQDFGVAPRVLE